ncbi:hypothetical protein [Sphingomonas ginsenosidivorax]|nr:hypothetical protein [Sphingomonas ginsenosidivorax]
MADCVKAFGAMGAPRDATIHCDALGQPIDAKSIRALSVDPTYPF